ncbi:uncharacterized protein [Henckelia pumila]|uniref:uncharacterized protein n=1 Tax=Henckelia pumila TaxID=405737 RepID=UPI003C6DD924
MLGRFGWRTAAVAGASAIHSAKMLGRFGWRTAAVAGASAIHSAKMLGRFGWRTAAVGATFTAVSLSIGKYRKKNDLINYSVGGFAAGATFAFTERSIPMAIAGGTLTAITPPLFSFFYPKPKQ